MTEVSQLIFALIEIKTGPPSKLSKDRIETTVRELIRLTSVSFGDDTEKWVEWYIRCHPNDEGKAFLKSAQRIYDMNKKYFSKTAPKGS